MLLCSGYSQANTVIGAKAQRHTAKTKLRVVVQRTKCIGFKSSDVHDHNGKVSRALLRAAKGCRKIIAPATSSRLGFLSLLLVYMLVTNRISGQQKDTIPPMHIAHIGMRQRLVPWPYTTILYLSRSMGMDH